MSELTFDQFMKCLELLGFNRCRDNEIFEYTLNSIMCMMDSYAKELRKSTDEAIKEYAEILLERSDKVFTILDSKGFYDDLRR